MRVVFSESRPINDTWFRRYLCLAAVKLLKRCRPWSGTVLFLSSRLCVKCGPFQHLSEASAMQFIAHNTSIPVPKVYCAFKHKGRTYIVMERIKGDMLARQWALRSEDSRRKILSQLKALLQEMRSLPLPKNFGVANVDGGTLYDCRLPGPSQRFGPFKTVQDFHRYLRCGFEAHPDHFPEVSELIAQQDQTDPCICFTHGDLSSLNILARGDSVVGVIDWETSGWYPSYWEYTMAWHVNPQNQFWRQEVDKFLEPMPKELAMEKIRWKYFGDI